MKKTLGIFVFGFIFTAVFLFSSTNAEAYTHVSTLRLGVNSSQVLSLQQALNNAGFIVSSSGAGSVGNETTYFGMRTKNAVIAFQKSKGLTADGIVGAKSGTALTSSIVSHYPEGCTSEIGFSETTGMPCSEGLDMGLIPSTCPNNPTAVPLSPTIQVLYPNGGKNFKIGETYEIKWLACNAPTDSWVKLSYSIPPGVGNIHYTKNCIGGEQLSASKGSYNWTISQSVFGCSDAGYIFPENTNFQTKIKAELYTGTPSCEGYPPHDDPCVTGTRTLHASDESNSYLTISNTAVSSDGQMCVSAGGNYDAQFGECAGIGSGQCGTIGGTWNECASACRNDPSAQVCTLQCVQVCKL